MTSIVSLTGSLSNMFSSGGCHRQPRGFAARGSPAASSPPLILASSCPSEEASAPCPASRSCPNRRSVCGRSRAQPSRSAHHFLRETVHLAPSGPGFPRGPVRSEALYKCLGHSIIRASISPLPYHYQRLPDSRPSDQIPPISIVVRPLGREGQLFLVTAHGPREPPLLESFSPEPILPSRPSRAPSSRLQGSLMFAKDEQRSQPGIFTGGAAPPRPTAPSKCFLMSTGSTARDRSSTSPGKPNISEAPHSERCKLLRVAAPHDQSVRQHHFKAKSRRRRPRHTQLNESLPTARPPLLLIHALLPHPARKRERINSLPQRERPLRHSARNEYPPSAPPFLARPRSAAPSRRLFRDFEGLGDEAEDFIRRDYPVSASPTRRSPAGRIQMKVTPRKTRKIISPRPRRLAEYRLLTPRRTSSVSCG